MQLAEAPASAPDSVHFTASSSSCSFELSGKEDCVMSPQATLYKIILPTKAKAEDFVSFMEKEVFTAVPTDPTRALHVTAQHLLHDSHTEKDYLWLIECEYNFAKVPEEAALAKLKAYGARVRMSSYTELLCWPDSSPGTDQ